MQSDHSSVHHTEISRIKNAEEVGWEFVCHSCGYCARYLVDRQGAQRLEIVCIGDPTARHTSGQISPSTGDWQDIPAPCVGFEDPGRGIADQNMSDELDAWLPPHLQAKIEAILSKYF